MNQVKKLASLLLALALLLAMAVPAMAAQGTTTNNGKITIDNAIVGQKYTIYKILTLESYNTTNKAYAYKAADDNWATFLKDTNIKSTYVKIDDQGYVTWVDGADVAAFAKLAKEYAQNKNLIPAKDTVTASDTTVEFTGLGLGYYLMDSTLGVLCSLDTTAEEVVIHEKNEAPSNEKTVEEDSSGIYGETNDADIGQTVNFKSTVTLPVGSENVVFHDVMTAGLTPNEGEGQIKVYTDAEMTTELDTAKYTVNSEPGDGCSFDVSFTKAYLDSLTAIATVYVKYSATVNANAVVADGNSNTSKLSYGDSSDTKETPGSMTKTFTWEFNVFKYEDKNGTKKALQGAEFILYKGEEGAAKEYAVISKGKLERWATAEADATKLITGKDGTISISGLDSDTYYLEETKAPDGYNKLSAPVRVVIDSEGKINAVEGVGLPNNTVEVENKTGAVMPSTGGIGTTIFYAVGGILVLAAVVLLITKRRVSAEK